MIVAIVLGFSCKAAKSSLSVLILTVLVIGFLPPLPAFAAQVSADSLVGYPSPPASTALRRGYPASLSLRRGFAVVRSWIIPTAEAAVSTDSLVGYWKFDEGTGTLAADSSGHNNSGTLIGGPTWSASPTNNITFTNPYALSFDGTDDYVDIGTSPRPTRDITASAWIKVDVFSPTGTNLDGIVGDNWDSNFSTGWWLGIYDGSKVRFKVNAWDTNFAEYTGFTDTSGWHHVVGVYNGSTIIVYVDGILGGTTDTYSDDINYASTDGVKIGQGFTGGVDGGKFDGLIDDVRIYSRALSSTEISALAAGNHTTAIWDGSSSTDWETSANWDINAVPDPFTNIIVRDTTNDPKLTASVSGASLTIEASSSLDLSGYNFELNDGGALKGGGTLKLKGNEVLSNLGNLGATSTGTVLYYGTGSFTGLAAGDSYNNLTINDGLVGYWTFDNGSGLSATDKSGHGNNGTLTSGPTWSADPTNNISFTNPYALSFDGTDDYVGVLHSSTLMLSNSLTISGWVNVNQYASAGHVVNDLVVKSDGSNGYYTAIDNNGKFRGLFYGTSNDGNWLTSSTTLSLDTWYHLDLTYDGTNTRLYVNGAQDISRSETGNITSNSAALQLGVRSGLSRYFNGLLDDVRIYNRALSPAEIAALAAGNQPSTGLGTVTLDSALDVNGDLTLNGGTLDASSSNYGVNIGGSLLNHGGIFNARKGTVTLDGTASSLQILSGGQRFAELTLNGNGATWTLNDRLTASGALSLTNGTLDVSSTGNFTVKAGTITQTSGTFTARSGLVVLTSPADQTATITSTLNTLRIEDSSENGLVGYWKFDEGTNSGAILDSAGSNNGVRRGGAGRIWTGSTLYTPSAIQFDNPFAMTFDGVDDYVDIGATGLSSTTGTLSAWVYKKASGRMFILEQYNPNGYVLEVGLSGNKVRCLFANTIGGDSIDITSPADITLNTWVHIACTSNGSSGELYVNGLSVGTDSGSPVSNANTLKIGVYLASSNYWNGLLDDVRIYNRALSANEVANLARGRYASGNSSTSTFTLGANLSTATLALDSGNLSTSNRTLTVTNALNILRGGGNLTLGSATTTLNGGLTLSGSTLTGGAGTLDINGNLSMSTGSLIAPSGTMTISGNFTMSGGILDSNGGTVTLDGSSDQGLRMPGTSNTQDFATLRINKSAGSLILGSAISGALLQLSQSTFSPGSTVVTAQATTIDGGTLTRGAANFNSRTLTLSSGTYNSNGQTSLWSGAVLLSGGTYTASTATQTFGSSLTISGGTYTGSTGTADINGTFTLNSGTFTAPSITLLSGNFTNVAGTFTQGSNLFTLDGNAQTLSGSLTFYDLTKTVSSGTTLFFHAGNTVTVTNTLTLQGAASNTLKLRSTTAATQWKIDPQVTRTLSYVDIQDSWNMNATAIDCTSSNCTDSGNNTNWTFPSTASTGGTGNNRARQRNAEAASGGGGGGGGGSVSTGTGATPFVFVPNYAPLATRLTEAQRKAREGSLALPTETARKILEIREALLARFALQLSDARKREEEREAAEAAFLEQDALATTEERRFARAQQLAQEKGGDRLSSPGKVAERRGLLSMVLGTQTVIYRDVSVTAWFAPYVSLLIEEDIAQGYKDDAGELTGEFGVANAVTLAEALKMALQAAEIPAQGGSPRNHSAQGTWAAPYIAEAEQRGISVLTPETDVHSPATRGEVVQIILEVLGITIGPKTSSEFSDVEDDHPYARAIATAAFMELIEGDSDADGNPIGTVRPDDSINRAEVSKIVAIARKLVQ